MGWIPMKTLLGYRIKGADRIHPKVFDSDDFKNLPITFPYRYQHKGEPTLSLNEEFSYRTLLSSKSAHLIREITLKRGRIILVYSAEPFLNYAMALPAQSRFAKEVLDYALRDVSHEGKIAYIDRAPVPPGDRAQKEQSPFRIFTVFPLNVIFFQLFVFMLFFLLSRASSGQPLAREAPYGSRDFTEHFRALGNLIRKSRK